jgi:hypothetical protein
LPKVLTEASVAREWRGAGGRERAEKKAGLSFPDSIFFGYFGFAELVSLKPSSVLLEEQKKVTMN